MAEWGRKEYSKAWPSRTPVWTCQRSLEIDPFALT
jgi:hypothetical protein